MPAAPPIEGFDGWAFARVRVQLPAASSRAKPFFRRSEGSCAESSRGVVEIRARSLAPLVKTRGVGMTPSRWVGNCESVRAGGTIHGPGGPALSRPR